MSYTQQQQQEINYQNQIQVLQNTILNQKHDIDLAMAQMNNRYNQPNSTLLNDSYIPISVSNGNSTGSNLISKEEEDLEVKGNALAESALARRRKRQSMIEGVTTPQVNIRQHRRSISSQSSTFSALSSSSASALTPALILSKPGESYPSLDETDKHSRNLSNHSSNSSHSTIDLIPALRNLQVENKSPPVNELDSVELQPLKGGGEGELIVNAGKYNGQPSRPSQAGRLAAALDGRHKRHSSNSNSTSTSSTLPSLSTPRAVSDSSPLSPFASSFNPIAVPLSNPYNPYYPSNQDFNPSNYSYNGNYSNNNNNNLYQQSLQQQFQQPVYYSQDYPTPIPSPNPYRQSPVLSYGTSTPIRKPRGPASETEFEMANFASRLRKQAIAMLGGRMRSH